MKEDQDELYIPTAEEIREVAEIAKTVLKSMEQYKPLPFTTGLNALVVALAAALVSIDIPYEKKINLASQISKAVIKNMYPNGAPN